MIHKVGVLSTVKHQCVCVCVRVCVRVRLLLTNNITLVFKCITGGPGWLVLTYVNKRTDTSKSLERHSVSAQSVLIDFCNTFSFDITFQAL